MYPDVYEGIDTCTPSYTFEYMYVLPRIRQGTCIYPHVYVRVHGCTQSFAAGYVYHLKSIVYWIWPLKFTVYRIENKSLLIGLAIYYWAIVLALCFGCFRLSAIFSAVVSVLRRCTITVLMHNTEATHPCRSDWRSITGRLSWLSVSADSDYRRSFPL
jgi:hypothetical protein